MTELRAIHDSPDEIPEEFQSLYTEKGGRWELTGISGVKTQADIHRLQLWLKKERDEHKATKATLSAWSDLGDLDAVQSALDRVPELEAAAGDKLDEAKIEEIATRRADAMVRSKLSPVERELAKIRKERDEAVEGIARYREQETRRTIGDSLRRAMRSAKVLPEAEEDVLLLGERVFEITDEGGVVTRDLPGLAAGLDPTSWLSEIQDRKPHWWPASVGGGASGSGSGGGFSGKNPWSAEAWNMTEQARIYREKGAETASRMAQAAGTTVGGKRPQPRRQ